MAKKNSKIRITKKDKEVYKSLTNRAKDKIRRIKKNYGDIYTGMEMGYNKQTEKIDLVPFTRKVENAVRLPKLEEFKTREEFNEWKESIQSFTKRQNKDYQFTKLPDGTVTTVRALNRMLKENEQTRERAEKLIKEFAEKPYAGGRTVYGHILPQMGKPEVAGITVPDPIDVNKIRGAYALERKLASVHNRAREDYYDWRTGIMRDNLVGVIEKAFNSDADPLVQKLSAMTPTDFLEMYLFYKQEFGFDIFYDNQGMITDENADLRAMESAYESFHSGGKEEIDCGKSFGNKERW